MKWSKCDQMSRNKKEQSKINNSSKRNIFFIDLHLSETRILIVVQIFNTSLICLHSRFLLQNLQRTSIPYSDNIHKRLMPHKYAE
jgi:hypothetical protein